MRGAHPSNVFMNRRTKRPLSLAGLRGFEAAARHLSFTLAADELHLTQSSISRQVQGLEAEVGRPLFVRKTRALALTPAGLRLARDAGAQRQDRQGRLAPPLHR